MALVLAVACGAAGQEPPPPVPSADVEARYAAVLDTIATLDRAIGRIDAFALGREGGSNRLLGDRRQARVDARRALYWRLATLAPELADSTARTTAVAHADSLLADDALYLRDRFNGNIDAALTAGRGIEELEGADRARTEQRLRSYDLANLAMFEAFDSTLAHRDALGADVTTDEEDLDRALSLYAELLAARMTLTANDIDALQERLDRGETGLDPTIAALDLRTRQTASSLRDLLDLMEERGLATADYRRFLLVSTGNLTADDLSWDVVRGLVAGWMGAASAWLAANSANIVFKILLFLGILLLFRIFASVINHVLARTLGRGRTSSRLLRDVILRWSTRLVMLLGLLFALSQIGVEVAPLLAGVGVAGFILGFALQDSLSNIAAGVMILIYRPFDVNDVVEVSGVTGRVEDMSMVSTTILSPDNQRYVVPNSKIWGNVIRNVTAHATRRVDLTFVIGYENDVPQAEKVLSEIVQDHPKVLEEPEATVKVDRLLPAGVEFAVRPWVHTGDEWTVTTDITREVKVRFDAEGIAFK